MKKAGRQKEAYQAAVIRVGNPGKLRVMEGISSTEVFMALVIVLDGVYQGHSDKYEYGC